LKTKLKSSFIIAYLAVLLTFLISTVSCERAQQKLQESISNPSVSDLENALQPDVISIKDLTTNAEFVCRARVIKVAAARERYDPTMNLVMSRIQLAITENWKGKLPSTVEIRSFGGVLDGVPYFASELPQFHKNEEVILFLKNFEGGLFPVLHAQGKKTIEGSYIQGTQEKLGDFKDQVLAATR